MSWASSKSHYIWFLDNNQCNWDKSFHLKHGELRSLARFFGRSWRNLYIILGISINRLGKYAQFVFLTCKLLPCYWKENALKNSGSILANLDKLFMMKCVDTILYPKCDFCFVLFLEIWMMKHLIDTYISNINHSNLLTMILISGKQ